MANLEIKKELYKQKPIAVFEKIRKGLAYYSTILNGQTIYFEIPVDDMGDGEFLREIPAQLLNRWIVDNKE